jgi:glycine cleavage system H protein
MNIPSELKYTKEHEWIKCNGNEALVGITDYAQSELGDIVFIEIDTVGNEIDKEQSFGTIEAVKTVSDVFMPVSGKIIEKNPKIEETPEIVNKDPYGEGWLVRIIIKDNSQLNDLLSAEAYKKHIGEE